MPIPRHELVLNRPHVPHRLDLASKANRHLSGGVEKVELRDVRADGEVHVLGRGVAVLLWLGCTRNGEYLLLRLLLLLVLWDGCMCLCLWLRSLWADGGLRGGAVFLHDFRDAVQCVYGVGNGYELGLGLYRVLQNDTNLLQSTYIFLAVLEVPAGQDVVVKNEEGAKRVKRE